MVATAELRRQPALRPSASAGDPLTPRPWRASQSSHARVSLGVRPGARLPARGGAPAGNLPSPGLGPPCRALSQE